jgi:hypothetical protein
MKLGKGRQYNLLRFNHCACRSFDLEMQVLETLLSLMSHRILSAICHLTFLSEGSLQEIRWRSGWRGHSFPLLIESPIVPFALQS